MASSRITPFPIYGWVPFRGNLYQITRGEVFRGDRLYNLGRYVGERYDERVLVNHWELLENMEEMASYRIGDHARHAALGTVVVVKRCWRFSEGRIIYHISTSTGPAARERCWQEQLSACANARDPLH